MARAKHKDFDDQFFQAADMFLAAAKQGLMQAQYAAGCCYILGIGVKKDVKQSGVCRLSSGWV